MDSHIWSVTLCRAAQEPIEPRVAKIINYLASEYPDAIWLIEDIDGLSHEAGALAHRMNDMGSFLVKHSELMYVFNADGQVIELNTL